MSRRFSSVKKRTGKRSAGAARFLKANVSVMRSSAFNQARGRSIIARTPATRGSRTFGVEIKSMDMPALNAGSDTLTKVISTTATIDVLNLVQEGASFYNRIGRRIHMKSVHVTGNFNPTGQAGTNGDYNRVLLVYDRQPNPAGTVPTISEILADYGQDGTTFTTARSKMNLNNVERFAILRDARLPQNELGTAVASEYSQTMPGESGANSLNWFVKLKDLETHYKSTSNSSTLGDIATGALYLVTFGTTAAATAQTQLTYNSRLRFTDI